MNLRSALLLVSLLSLPVAAGCAAGAAGDDVDSSGAAVTAGTQGADRAALLTAVHARLAKDFAGATSASLKSYTLVFDVRQLDSNATKAFFRGRVLKQDAAGKTHELTNADFAGTEFAAYIAEGLFDGPEVVAALTKANGKWTIASKNIKGDAGPESYEGYSVGSTDVAWYGWDTEFGLETKWLGLGSTNDVDGG